MTVKTNVVYATATLNTHFHENIREMMQPNVDSNRNLTFL